jgi:hypothetical protein
MYKYDVFSQSPEIERYRDDTDQNIKQSSSSIHIDTRQLIINRHKEDEKAIKIIVHIISFHSFTLYCHTTYTLQKKIKVRL